MGIAKQTGAKYVVFSGLMRGRNSPQVRSLIAAKSRAEASRITGVPSSHLKAFWSLTGNREEIEVALSQPGVLFQASSAKGRDFVAVLRGFPVQAEPVSESSLWATIDDL